MHIPTLIARKRDGGALSETEIRFLVEGHVSGTVPDSQMSAFAMAVLFRGMAAAETAALTSAMMESGECFHHPPGPPLVDKHSTGGIGDKTSLVLAPLLASAGCRVPMVSGRGLGITGGTLDKLESIPGLRVRLSMSEASSILARTGVVMMGQTEQFCPADRKLYALRDVTATVPSIPLITASIMSKKLAESLDRLVLDVKYGSGAFMKTRAEAEELAAAMEAAGRLSPTAIHVRLHPMDEPTGHAVGNALEVREALACLDGKGPADLRKLVLDLAEPVASVARQELETLLDSGAARSKFGEMVAAQGGDPGSLERLDQIHRAPVIAEFRAPSSGIVRRMDAGTIGLAALQLGAGRAQVDDRIDPAVGFDQIPKIGTEVRAGDPFCRIHARTESAAAAAQALLLEALEIVS